jgi:hypothetical protein
MNQPRTFKLATVVAKVAEDFPNFNPTFFGNKSFEDTAREAVLLTTQIIAFKSDKKESNVIIVLERKGKPKPFQVIRLFPLGEKWALSHDIIDGDAVDVFNRFLEAEYDEEE